MVVRLLAMLVALGLCISSAQAHDLCAQPAIVIVVDEADDAAEHELVVVESDDLGESRRSCARILGDTPPNHRHHLLVFRPPRSYAFS